MPDSWTPMTIGDVASVILSSVDKHIVPGEISVRLCNYLDVYENRRIHANMPFSMGTATPGEIARFQISEGDVLITKDSETADDIGIPAVVEEEPVDTLCGYHLAIVRPHSNVNPKFLGYIFESDIAKRHFLRTANGVTRFGLGLGAISSLAFTLPPLSEQQAITTLLESVDATITCLQSEQSHALRLQRGLSQHLLTHGIRAEQTKSTSIGDLPVSWTVVPVRDVVTEFQYGLSEPMQVTGSIPILRMGNIQQGDVVFDDLKYLSLPQHVTERYLLHRGDVLFNRTNSQEHVGKVGIYRDDRPAIFASYLIRLQPNMAVVDPYFLGQVLGSYSVQCRIKRYATPGVQQVNINATNLGQVLIPLPSDLAEQRQIATALEEACARVRTCTPRLHALRVLKRSLVQDLLSEQARSSRADLVAS